MEELFSQLIDKEAALEWPINARPNYLETVWVLIFLETNVPGSIDNDLELHALLSDENKEIVFGQTAPLGAVWSGTILFAHIFISENFGSSILRVQTKNRGSRVFSL